MHFDPRDHAADLIASVVNDRLIAEAERGLRHFIKLAWPIIEPGTDLVPGWHLDAICEHLEAVTRGEIRNLLINVPPRHMKSLAVGVFWPAWEWITFPHRRWLFSSYALSLSERDSVKCRRLIESPLYQTLWGGCYQLCGDQNTKLRYENDRAGHRIATSVGGAATGEGGDRVIVDDPHNVVDRDSEAFRVAALTWWDETMSMRLNDPKTGAKVIVMQRIHEKDLSGHVLEQGGYVHLCLPAEFEVSRRCRTTLGWTDPRRREGELLWPHRVGEKEIADFKVRLGPESYAGQFQQRPAPAGGGRFRGEWFRYFRVDGGVGRDDAYSLSPVRGGEGGGEGPSIKQQGIESNLEIRPSPQFDFAHFGQPSPPRTGEREPERSRQAYARPSYSLYELLNRGHSSKLVRATDCDRFAVMDPAGTEPGEGRRPCYTVIQVWDITPHADMLLVHQYRKQVQAPDAAAAAVRICREWEVAYIAIEKDGMGLGVVQQVRREGITVKAIKARGSKEARSQTAEIRMSAGQVYFPQGAPFLFELEGELLQFPNSEYADQVDALSHAAMLVQRIGGAVADDFRAAEPGHLEHEEAWEHCCR